MFWIHRKTRGLIRELAGKYGLNLPLQFLAARSSIACEYCTRMWKTHDATDDEELKIETK